MAALLFVMNFRSSVLPIAGHDASMLHSILRIRQNVFRATLSTRFAYIFRASHLSRRPQQCCVRLSTIVITPPLFDPEQYSGLLQVFPEPVRYYVVHTFEDFEETLRNSVLGRLDYQSLCSHCSAILME